MPSTRPCAAFEPISPDFDLKALVETTPNFEYAVRIHSDMIEHHGIVAFERLVLQHVILGGKPLVIEGYEARLDSWIFAIQWLRDNCGSNVVDARDLTKQVNVPMSIGHYLKHMSLLTNQWSGSNYKDPERQRMYLKDIDCPPIWKERVAQHIPPFLFYLNESTGEYGGMGSIEEPDPNGAGTRKGRGIAKAGDLMSSLPPEMRAENLMCYIGHEGTYTPSHREMCASLGHNVMVEASSGIVEDGHKTRPGSSIWFMTESKEREVVSEYWLSRLGHDIEVEKHFAQINAWKIAPFKVYIVNQRPGDFILIPPLAPHQVWNRGTRTMKIAWNRTTVETLEMAMNEALFKARMVCRDEQYKNKAIIYFTLEKYAKFIQQADKHKQKNPASKRVQKADLQVKQLTKDFKRLHALFTRILVEESFYGDRVEKKVEMVPFEGVVTCSYCRGNIYNRFLTCPTCVVDLPGGDQDTYDVCLDCYAMGRSCACISKLKWAEQWDWGTLVQKHESWRHLIIQHEGQVNEKSPKSLKHELDKRGKRRTTAQICQTELLKRPFHDIRKPLEPTARSEEEEIEVDENGKVKKRKVKKKSEKFIREHGRCHVDCYWEPRWKQAKCTKCDKNFCYGLLYRAYDMMPQDILANPEWTCPSCLKICGCRHCRGKPGYKRYTPKGTLLGHNTKAVADPRSVESLVDFSNSNIQWIQKADDDYDAEDTRRMQRRRREADAAMSRNVDLAGNDIDEDEVSEDVEGGILRLAEQEGIPIDPALSNVGWTAVNDRRDTPSDDEINENPEEVFRRSDQPDDVGPTFMLPDGVMVQDLHHPSYAPTDMISFTYPDPIMGTIPPAPVEGYQEAAEQLPYQEAEPPSPSKIEMVERKRKRKLEDEDRAFHPTAPKSHKKKTPKKRQSLVMKLMISRDRLAQFDSMMETAQSDSEALPVQAPVVSSDLQALNVVPSEDGQPPKKKLRQEDRAPPTENDVEYAPSRYRDRRKAPQDGTPLAPRVENVERRNTRLHHVTYAEPEGEEEFNEKVVPKAKIMESGHVVDSIEQPDDLPDSDHENNASASKVAGKRPALTTPSSLANLARSGLTQKHATFHNPVATSPNASRPSTASSAQQGRKSKLEAQASANRRAKMAALEDGIDDIDDLEYMSDEASPQPVRPSQAAARPSSSTTTVNARATNGSVSKLQRVTNGSGFAAVNKSSKATMASYSAPSKSASIQKAAADDWADSDSD